MVGDVDETPGWAAIDAALQPIYWDVEPLHWGTLVRWRWGGPDPLDGISCYQRTDPVPHWHFVSYGMTELYEKEFDDPGVSGWGFELTFRLARDQGRHQAVGPRGDTTHRGLAARRMILASSRPGRVGASRRRARRRGYELVGATLSGPSHVSSTAAVPLYR